MVNCQLALNGLRQSVCFSALRFCRLRLVLRSALPAVAVLCALFTHRLSVMGGPVGPFAEPPTKEQAENFRSKVFPILESRCFECHGSDEDVEAELRLNTRAAMLKGGESGPAIVPSDPDRSLLIQAVRYESFQMPPRSRMPDEEIRILSEWVKDGAPWPDDEDSAPAMVAAKNPFPLEERKAAHWAWKPIRTPSMPDVQHSDWSSVPTDRFLLAGMEARGLVPVPDADRRSLIRRVYFDLIGMPPSLAEQDRFLQDPADLSVALEKLVDELLASPHFGERWARHWLDLVRYAETLGHEFDYPLPYAWRYRDYVIRALNADVPYDQFVREHIAGDLLTPPRRNPEQGFNESIIATGFWFLCEDKHAPVDVKGEEASRIDNQLDVFGKTFLGLTIACARCHDHKFDPITTEDYYALSGFLQSSRRRVEFLDQQDSTATLVQELLTTKQTAEQELRAGLGQLDLPSLKQILLSAVTGESSGDVSETARPALLDLLRRPETTALSHPLSLPATLVQRTPERSVAETLTEWAGRRDTAVAIRKPPEDRIVQFAGGLPPGWRAFGPAMTGLSRQRTAAEAGSLANAGRDLKWSTAGIVPAEQTVVTSALLSPRLTGVLHSEEFELQHPEILILAAGQRSRVKLVIDGYVMNEFSELLFSGCRQPIDTDGKFRWIRIAGDVKRYLGHRCHLEFLDEDDGWFAVREIRFVSLAGTEIPVPADVCETSRNVPVRSDADLPSVLEAWCDAAAADPEAIRLLIDSDLFPAEAKSRLTQLKESWLQSAAKPQRNDFPVLAICDGPGEDESVFVRGNHRNRGGIAPRRLMTALDQGRPLNDPSGSARLELANRVLANDNPFPARVVVNRVWQHLFGRGIVASSDNFGVLGEAPTHPELLDYLADEFRQDGWSLKRLIRRLMLSRSYRLSSARSPGGDEIDPANLLFHRFSIRRLDAEAIRDAVLTVSGRIDRTMWGPPVPVYLSSFMQGRGRPGQSGPLDGDGRRSIYQSVRRNFLNPFMLAFDTPQPATTVGRRSMSNVPAQALMMLNNEFIHQQAEHWASQLRSSGEHSADDILNLAYRTAFCRQPQESERTGFQEFAEAYAAERKMATADAWKTPEFLQNVCHVLLNQKEFLYSD